MSDFIKLHRCIEDWEWYKDVNTFKVFIHLLLEANWKDGFWKGRVVKRGQTVTSRSKLSRETGLSEREIRTALQHLKSTNEVTYETTKHYTLVTVVNYEVYQDKTDKCDQQNDQENRQQTTTIEEIKNNKNNISSANKEKIDCPYEQIKDLYNAICISLPAVQKLTESRKKKIASRWRDNPSLDTFNEIFTKAEKSDFLTGKTTAWKCTFDWLMENDKNYCKVLEGNYDNKPSKSDKPESPYREI
jgi:biotin operon repressor